MRKFGLKLFSTNLNTNPALLEQGIELVKKHSTDMFIELMIKDSGFAELDVLAKMFAGIEVRLHAPHHLLGFDAGNHALESSNRKLLEPVQYAADIMHAKTMVVHAGCGEAKEHLKETIRQFKLFNDKRIVVENLPLHSDGVILHGTTPAEIKTIMEQTGCGFCFDFSHAVCAAYAMGCKPEALLAGFYALNPTVYHLCDGFTDDEEDNHFHYGDGKFPLGLWLKKYTADDAYITMETGMTCPQDISPWAKDYEYIRKLG